MRSPPRETRRIHTIVDTGTGTGQWTGWPEHFSSQLWEFFCSMSFVFFYFSNCGGVPVEATPVYHC